LVCLSLCRSRSAYGFFLLFQNCQHEIKRLREKELVLQSELTSASKEILRLRELLKNYTTNPNSSTVWRYNRVIRETYYLKSRQLTYLAYIQTNVSMIWAFYMFFSILKKTVTYWEHFQNNDTLLLFFDINHSVLGNKVKSISQNLSLF